MKILFLVLAALFATSGVVAILQGDFVVGLVLFGLAYLMYTFFKKKQGKKTSQPFPVATYDKPRYDNHEFFIAWSNKYSGYKKMIEEYKEKDLPYEGMSTKDIRETLEWQDRVYKYEVDYIRGIYLEDEPTNQYNPEAIKVMSKDYGQLGYITDADLEEVRGLLKQSPSISVKLYGGDYKYLDLDDKLVTEKGKVKSDLVIGIKL